MKKERWTGKSMWLGKTGEEVNVETLVLHHLEFDGFKGYRFAFSLLDVDPNPLFAAFILNAA